MFLDNFLFFANTPLNISKKKMLGVNLSSKRHFIEIFDILTSASNTN